MAEFGQNHEPAEISESVVVDGCHFPSAFVLLDWSLGRSLFPLGKAGSYSGLCQGSKPSFPCI
jgi:hypothetical protein